MKRVGQISLGILVTIGLFAIGTIFAGGKVVQSMEEQVSINDKQDKLLEQLVKNGSEVTALLARQDERLKTLESRK